MVTTRSNEETDSRLNDTEGKIVKLGETVAYLQRGQENLTETIEVMNKNQEEMKKCQESMLAMLHEMSAKPQKRDREKGMDFGGPSHIYEQEVDEGDETGNCWRHRGTSRRLELPLFDGGDPRGWICRAEQYFDINDIMEADKVRAATVCFEKGALTWWQWVAARWPIRTWPKLKVALLDRFRSTTGDTGYPALIYLRQESTVADYVAAFEHASCTTPEASEELLTHFFICGLKEEIGVEMKP